MGDGAKTKHADPVLIVVVGAGFRVEDLGCAVH
jgi:hypothetical protein